MNLLERIKEQQTREGTCETCGNLVQVTNNLIGCGVHDKLILPEYPPYHGRIKCSDYSIRDRTKHKQKGEGSMEGISLDGLSEDEKKVIGQIVDEAAKLLKDYPEMPYPELIRRAKEMIS